MGILAGYVVREILKLFFPIWLAFGFALFTLEWLAQVFNVKTTAVSALVLYLLKVPAHLQIVFPVAVLLACLLALGSMNRSREVVAAQSLGYGRKAILVPTFFAIGLAMLPYYLVVDQIAPWGMWKHYDLFDTQVRNVPSRFSQVQREKMWYRNQDVLYQVGYFDPDKNELYDVVIYTFDDEFHIVQTLTAERATWNGGAWTLTNGHVTLLDQRLETPLHQPFSIKTTRLIEDPRGLQRIDYNAETMTQMELWRAIQRHRGLGINTSQWEVVFHSRYTFFLITIVFVLLAYPRALRFRRVEGAAKDGAFVAGTCLVYWLMFTFAANLGNTGRVNPAFAVWTPSLIFLVGVLVYNRFTSLRNASL